MDSKQAMTRLEQARLALDIIKNFKEKAAIKNKISDNIHFLNTHKSDDIAHLFVKQTRRELEQLAVKIPEISDDIKGVISAVNGRLVLSGNIET